MNMERPEEHALDRGHWTKLASIAEGILRKDESDPRSFADVFSASEIEHDLSALERRDKSFVRGNEIEQKLFEMATVLEAIICQQGSLNEWFGSDVDVIKTTRFDDVMHGVDAVLELLSDKDDNVEHLALAIDVTFNSDVEGEKLRRILNQIDAGKLASVRYFDSEHEHGEIEAPEVILGIDRKHVEMLAEDWVEGIDEHNMKKLATHPARDLFAVQVIEQCKAFAAYAAFQNNTKAQEQYEAAGAMFAESLAGVGWKRRAIDARFADDEVHREMMRALERLPKIEQPVNEENSEIQRPKRRFIVTQKKT